MAHDSAASGAALDDAGWVLGGQVSAPAERRTHHAEILLLLGVSLGSAAIYAVLRIIERATRHVALNQQSSSLNASVTPDRPWLDLAYQLTGILLGVVPALFAIFLLRHRNPPTPPTIGADRSRPAQDLLRGLGLAALIGLPGLAFYLVGRAIGITTDISAASLGSAWWTIPVLVLAAVQNSVLEEVVVVAYLLKRLDQAGWRLPAAVAASAVLRGAYHLYQGYGPFLGNAVMGVVFALFFVRTRRVMPLVVAHAVLDIVAFVGYSLVAPHVSWL